MKYVNYAIYILFLFAFLGGVLASVSYLFKNLDEGKRGIIMVGVVALVYFAGALLLGGFPE